MKNYAYNVNAYGESNESTYRTNDVRDALDAFLKSEASGIHCDLLNGYTGEVLAIANSPSGEYYATDEITLMIKGMIFEAWEGENIAPKAEEDDPEAEEDDPEPEAVEPDDLFALLEQMVAEGKAVKLGGMPS